jgi:hypothetical protein
VREGAAPLPATTALHPVLPLLLPCAVLHCWFTALLTAAWKYLLCCPFYAALVYCRCTAMQGLPV